MYIKKRDLKAIEKFEAIKKISGRKKRICPICGGDGWEASPTRVEVCRICHGKGMIW